MQGTPPSIFRDRRLWAAVLLAFACRAYNVTVALEGPCTRDECTYRELAKRIVEGQGLTTEQGWLWAPGWPYVLAACLVVFGTVNAAKVVQLAAALATVLILGRLGERVSGRDAGLLAAGIYAVHPTFVFFAGSLWSEVTYTAFLLGAVLALLWAREGGFERALLPGLLIGLCVLFRGVATYMAPIFAIAALWPAGEPVREALRARAGHAAVVLLGAALVVAPYTLHASRTNGGFMLSDATLGQMMWLGNNDFPPITFDWGNGLLEPRAYDAWTDQGRAHCDADLPPAQWDRCEVRAGIAWIGEHPAEFAGRAPLRLAQLLNPHSFLTRDLRWGKVEGIPWELKEGTILAVVFTSFAVVLGGLVGGFARGKGPFAVLAGGIVGYHVLAIAALLGLSRYRLPLEGLGIVFLAMLLADPRSALAALKASPPRAVGAAVALLVTLPLMLWFLPAGFPR